MSESEGEEAPPVHRATLRPYASVIILRCVDVDPSVAFQQLWKKLKKSRRVQGATTKITVVGSGFANEPVQVARDQGDDEGPDEIDVLVHRLERKPNWLSESTFTNVTHELTLAVRFGGLIAVHAPAPVRDVIQKWLNKEPKPHVRRLPPHSLEDALLRGESKSLWLRSTHSPRSTKADSKAVVGIDLRESLMPFEDSAYAMGAARAALEDSPERTAFKGVVGTTPQASLVWNKQMERFDDYIDCIRELLVEVRTSLDDPDESATFPYLSQRVYELDGVVGAYDIAVASPSELPFEPGVSDDKIDAANLLSEALLDVTRDSDSANFTMRIGLNGSEAGIVRGRVEVDDGAASISFGYTGGNPKDPKNARLVLDALDFSDLLTIYYESGHVLEAGQVSKPYIQSQPFPRWRFESFDDYRVDQEKPKTKSPQEIHDRIGVDGDSSLFSWVVKHFSDGWLTCDDGSGEVADFIHVSPEGTLSLIHVKGAESSSEKRKISSKAYEVVVSQATKNIGFLEDTRLAKHLEKAPVSEPACWNLGTRCADRTELIDAVNSRNARMERQIVVVQPHITEVRYNSLYNEAVGAAPKTDDALRLNRVENILNANRTSVTGVGAELVVISAKK